MPPIRIASKIFQPMQQSPLIRQLGEAISRASYALGKDEELVAGSLKSFANRVPVNQRLLLRSYMEGEMEDVPTHIRQVGDEFRNLNRDTAERVGTKPYLFYATRPKNKDAMYSLFRKQLADATNISDLEPQIQLKIPNQASLNRLKAVSGNYGDWGSLPKVAKREFEDLWFFKDISKWEDLPLFMKRQLPEEIFSPYLLPRTASKYPFIEDPIEAAKLYFPSMLRKINFDGIEKFYSNVIKRLPNVDSSGSEANYMKTLVERDVLLRKPKSVNIDWISEKIYDTFGKHLITSEGVNTAAIVARHGFYRNLSLDSAISNATGVVNNWMESGTSPFIRALGRHIKGIPDMQKKKGLFGSMTRAITGDPFYKPSSEISRRVLEVDEFVNRIAMWPMTISEMNVRGVAFEAGIDEALKLGMKNDVEILVNGFAKASKIFPKITMPETEIHSAFRYVPKTQGGSRPGEFTPFLRGPLGRISSVLLTYPPHQMAVFRNGFADAISRHDNAKLIRYTAGLGMFVTLPMVAIKLGADVNSMFGAKGVLANVSFPFIQAFLNGIRSFTGNSPRSQKQARDAFQEFITALIIPQYRYAKKVFDPMTGIIKNIERGYNVDKYGRFLYESTPYGELMKLIGVKPAQAYNSRVLARTLFEFSQQHAMDKREAIFGMIQGDQSLVEEYMKMYGRRITPQDVQRVIKEMAMSPEQRALRGVPKDLRGQALEEAENDPIREMGWR